MSLQNQELEVAVAEVVDYLRITQVFSPALEEVIRRKVTAEEAKESGISVSDEELQRAADGFRAVNGLNKASDTELWLRANGISQEKLEEFLEVNILMEKFKIDLGKKTAKEKYVSSSQIQENIRELIYEDWISRVLS